MWFASGFTVIVSFFGSMRAMFSVSICVLIYCRVYFKNVGCIFECCHMVESLGAWPGIILVWDIYFHSSVNYLQLLYSWDCMGLRFWCICFPPFNSHFWIFSFFDVTVKFLLLIGRKKWTFFAGFTGWSYSEYDSTIGTLRDSSLVTGYNWGLIFIWALSWFTS